MRAARLFRSSPTAAKTALAPPIAARVQGRGNQATLRRQTTDDDPKKTPKPLLPLPVVDQFDPLPYLPLPGGAAPTPYDPPGKVPPVSGTGPSLEDLNKGLHGLFDKAPLNLGMKPGKMPSCSALETTDSTSRRPRYMDFRQYDLQRRLYHDPMSKDPWPMLSEGEYDAFVKSCPQGEPEPPRLERPSPQPVPDPVLPPLPKGQAYA